MGSAHLDSQLIASSTLPPTCSLYGMQGCSDPTAKKECTYQKWTAVRLRNTRGSSFEVYLHGPGRRGAEGDDFDEEEDVWISYLLIEPGTGE